MQANSTPPKRTSSGLDDNLAGTLCYVGWWVSGIIFLIIEPDSKFVRFHAIQSIIAFGIITVALAIVGPLPFVGPVLSPIIGLTGFALWIAMMVKAHQGARYKLPWAGEIAERYSAGKTG